VLAVFVCALLAVPAINSAIAADPVVSAVGDMGCPPTSPNYNGGNGTSTSCRQKYVSDLLVSPIPTAFLPLGDNQYDSGTLSEFQAVYHPTFGRVNSVVYPSIGNAEYETANAQGWFDYYSSVGVLSRISSSGGDSSHLMGGGYYSFNIGSWHLIALNSNCAAVGGCGAGSPQDSWLRADLAAHPAACTLAYWHHPRFTSGDVGNTPEAGNFWDVLYGAGADVVLNGHAHDYERFAPQTPGQQADPQRGIREFVVGTGGEDFHAHLATQPNSEVLRSDTFGVLQLTLRGGGYDWRFSPAAGGTFTEGGSAFCH
jgi:acid phosphatase type 7